jgi:hypothetical protein
MPATPSRSIGALSRPRATTIYWAAFYSDCEHGVKELTDGHRVTLTYNLYHAPGVGNLAEYAPAIQVTSLPLYHIVYKALAEPEFMRDGGALGIYCTHAYAHNMRSGGRALPAVLKGADMAMYAVFRALGLKVGVRPVMTRKGWYWNPNDERDPEHNTRAGTHLGELIVTEACADDYNGLDGICSDWEHDKLHVNWLTDPAPEELDEATLVHPTVSGVLLPWEYCGEF